jgi:ferritin-like metal-binding protein YciE
VPGQDLNEQLVKYLEDVHSAEQHAITQLEDGANSADDESLASVLRDHLIETQEHARLIAERLDAYDSSASTMKDAAQKGVAKATGMVAKSAPDTSGKVAIQAFAFEHLEIASYRMLRRVAERAGDEQTVAVADQILAQEKAAAEKLSGLLEQVADRDLERQGVAA